MPVSVPSMLTIGEIARRLGKPVHRVQYIIRARGIRPYGWAGNARVFPEDAVDIIAAEIERIQSAKGRDRDRRLPQATATSAF